MSEGRESLEAGRIEVRTGDITKAAVDAIVNAANSSLLGGGGVDGAIHRAGGPAILAECRKIREERYPNGMPAGQAVVTTAGRLPCKWVIHTVGPVRRGGSHGEEATLKSAYTNSLAAAADAGLERVAFPAISTGVYGYPRDLAARAAYDAVSAFLAGHALPRHVELVFFSESDKNAFLAAIRGS
jgi:O-acetyl-ADP-ribose deacetylase